ncbi:aromatic-ring-hydroxylating dioxygenase subunit beta [Shewanella dokdonensis]|uniref:aromatic-ring-hydroxylating dioxygenase subunit beta n=1 Tax=Shewanella dokdonensis TaxID=712036 RepID=UPI00201008BA|nr:aromatic-ring-hydroxylating dioxygenase subunit beta [Shewanella dokdonensis]MCL1073862.1 aromatic-ring-hydroxylating dioxygenase subunit beta [Shewanella dokdonensis]
MSVNTDPMQDGFTLEDILRDTLESTYIDDAYYAKLRNDMQEWEGCGTVLNNEERHAYESLILHENWLLDRRAFEKWYQLYSRECVYWVPAVGDLPDAERADPQRQVTIAFDDRRRLGDRIVWLRTGVAYSQLPPSYTSHVSTAFVRLPSENAGEVKIRSQFLIQEMRAGHEIQTFSGWMGHVFIKEDGVTKIARKVVCLLDAPRNHHNLTFLL